MLNKKPKCRGCGKAGTVDIYYWQTNKNKREGEPDGYLWHLSCAWETATEIHDK